MQGDPDSHFAIRAIDKGDTKLSRCCPLGSRCPLYPRLDSPETVINLEYNGITINLCAEVGGYHPHPNVFHQHYSMVHQRVLKKLGTFSLVRATPLAYLAGRHDCAIFMVDLGPGTQKFPDQAIIASKDSPMMGDYILGWKNHRNFCGCIIDDAP